MERLVCLEAVTVIWEENEEYSQYITASDLLLKKVFVSCISLLRLTPELGEDCAPIQQPIPILFFLPAMWNAGQGIWAGWVASIWVINPTSALGIRWFILFVIHLCYTLVSCLRDESKSNRSINQGFQSLAQFLSFMKGSSTFFFQKHLPCLQKVLCPRASHTPRPRFWLYLAAPCKIPNFFISRYLKHLSILSWCFA